MAGRGFSTAGIFPPNLARAVSFYDQNNAARDVWSGWFWETAPATPVAGTGDIVVGGAGRVGEASVSGSGSILVGGTGVLTPSVDATGSITVGGTGVLTGGVSGTGSITLGGVGTPVDTPVGAPFVLVSPGILVPPEPVCFAYWEPSPVVVVQEGPVAVAAEQAVLVGAELMVITWRDEPAIVVVTQERMVIEIEVEDGDA
jgi:hypothetical protein